MIYKPVYLCYSAVDENDPNFEFYKWEDKELVGVSDEIISFHPTKQFKDIINIYKPIYLPPAGFWSFRV